MKQAGCHHRPGFTLVELLVVIAIITVLISLLIPTIGKFLQASKRTACAANLRQIQSGMLAYAIANDGWYPLPCPGTADGAYNFNTAEGGDTAYTDRAYPNWKTGIGWLTARQGSMQLWSGTGAGKQPYLTNWRIFYCPTAEKKNVNSTARWWTNDDTVSTAGLHTITASTSYTAFASNYCQWNAWSPEYKDYTAKRMSDSPRRVLTGDKLGWIRGSNRWALDFRPTNDLVQNHLSGANFVFNDGSVDYRLIGGPTDKTGFRVTGSTNSNTAYWYALPDITNGY
jgi:prepilin-type N-terminal cleavage/methylation domain-containing protein